MHPHCAETFNGECSGSGASTQASSMSGSSTKGKVSNGLSGGQIMGGAGQIGVQPKPEAKSFPSDLANK